MRIIHCLCCQSQIGIISPTSGLTRTSTQNHHPGSILEKPAKVDFLSLSARSKATLSSSSGAHTKTAYSLIQKQVQWCNSVSLSHTHLVGEWVRSKVTIFEIYGCRRGIGSRTHTTQEKVWVETCNRTLLLKQESPVASARQRSIRTSKLTYQDSVPFLLISTAWSEASPLNLVELSFKSKSN